VNDPRIVTDVTDAAGAVASADSTPAEQQAGLAELRGKLYETVGRFAALPTGDPGRSDAAFCLFLHVYASSDLRVMPTWPTIAARFLEITAPGGDALRAAEGRDGERTDQSPATGERQAHDRHGG
jgi:hypothetical protein